MLRERLSAMLLAASLTVAAPMTATLAGDPAMPSDATSSTEVNLAEQLNAQAVDLFRTGKYADAQPLFEQALEIRRRLLGEDSPDTAISYDNLAANLSDQGRYVDAQPLYERALEIRRRILGENHPDTAKGYNSVAANLKAQGRYADAQPFFEQALEIRRRVLGEDHPDTATSYNNIATNLKAQGRYADAQPLYEKALDIRRRIAGEDRQDTANSYNNVAANLDALGRYADAQPFYERALEIYQRVLGANDPATALGYNNLAANLNAQGRYADAQPLFEKALEIRERALGEHNRETASSYNNLGANLNAQGRYADAQPLYEKALDIRRSILGENHPDTARSYNNVAFNLDAQGRYADAQPLFEKALDIRRRTLGESHPNTAQSYNSVGANLNAQGRYADAQPFLEKALDIRRRALGENHPDTARSYNNLAANLNAQKRYSDAQPLHEKALGIRRRVLGENHRETAQSYSEVAANLRLQGRYADAQPFYQKALAINQRVLGENHPDTARSFNGVAANLYAQGRYADAEPLYAKALEIRRKVLGDSHPDTALSYNNLAASLISQGRYADAQPLIEKAVDLRRRTLGDQHPDVTQSLGNMASNLLGGNHATEALQPARSAISQLRARRATDSGSDESQQLRDARSASNYFVLFTDVLWAATPPGGRSAVTDEAFQALQDAIASSAGAAVAQMGARFSSGDETLRRLARERQDLGARWSANDSALAQALGSSDPGAAARVDNIRTDTATIRQRLDAIDAELKQRFPAYFDLIRPEALPVAAVQSLLKEGEAILLVVPGSRGTHVVAVSKSKMDWVRSDWKAEQVSGTVARLRCDLDRSRCAGTPAAEVRGATRTDAPTPGKAHSGFDRRAAYELYQQIVAPVMPVLAGARNVYVVTSDALSSLPFSVLVTGAPKDGENDADPQVLRSTPWLLRQFALTTLPSVASLKALRTFEQQAAGATTAAKYDFIGMGDPVLGAETGSTGGRGPTRASSLFTGIASNGAGLADPQALRASFSALPGTKVELEAMQRAFAPRAAILLGPQATETAVKTTPFEGVKVVAFSTHGLVAGEIDGIAEPGLVFTPPTKATAEDDGLLTATEVAQLKLSADWVLLSACNTASSDGTPGADALSGLARAFFYAGARSLLVSHWPVRDDVASRLTVDAIKREREHPELGRAEALRQATLAVLDGSAGSDPTLAQPASWAPFSLVGEGM